MERISNITGNEVTSARPLAGSIDIHSEQEPLSRFIARAVRAVNNGKAVETMGLKEPKSRVRVHEILRSLNERDARAG